MLLADHRGDAGGAVAQHPPSNLPVLAGLHPASGRGLVVEAEGHRPGPVPQRRVTQPLQQPRGPAELGIGGPPVRTAQVLGLGGDDHRPALRQVADRERGVGGRQVREQRPGQPQVPAAGVRGLPAGQRHLGPDARLLGTSTLAGQPDRQQRLTSRRGRLDPLQRVDPVDQVGVVGGRRQDGQVLDKRMQVGGRHPPPGLHCFAHVFDYTPSPRRFKQRIHSLRRIR